MATRAGFGEVSFATHEDAVRACRVALEPWFELFQEVELSSNQLLEKALRVDLLAVPKNGGWILGVEVKPGFYRMSEYAKAIKQAADYRLSLINDPRLPMLKGRRVSGGFVFPRWHGGHDHAHEYRSQAYGMERLSHHFRVGFGDYDNGHLTLIMDDKRLWSSAGWSGNASGVLSGKERVGSLKVTDPSRFRPEW